MKVENGKRAERPWLMRRFVAFLVLGLLMLAGGVFAAAQSASVQITQVWSDLDEHGQTVIYVKVTTAAGTPADPSTGTSVRVEARLPNGKVLEESIAYNPTSGYYQLALNVEPGKAKVRVEARQNGDADEWEGSLEIFDKEEGVARPVKPPVVGKPVPVVKPGSAYAACVQECQVRDDERKFNECIGDVYKACGMKPEGLVADAVVGALPREQVECVARHSAKCKEVMSACVRSCQQFVREPVVSEPVEGKPVQGYDPQPNSCVEECRGRMARCLSLPQDVVLSEEQMRELRVKCDAAGEACLQQCPKPIPGVPAQAVGVAVSVPTQPVQYQYEYVNNPYLTCRKEKWRVQQAEFYTCTAQARKECSAEQPNAPIRGYEYDDVVPINVATRENECYKRLARECEQQWSAYVERCEEKFPLYAFFASQERCEKVTSGACVQFFAGMCDVITPENDACVYSPNGWVWIPSKRNVPPVEKKFLSGDGCVVNGKVLPFSARLIAEDGVPSFCSYEGKVVAQKAEGESAQESFECLSNRQSNGVCAEDVGLLRKIFKVLGRIFGV